MALHRPKLFSSSPAEVLQIMMNPLLGGNFELSNYILTSFQKNPTYAAKSRKIVDVGSRDLSGKEKSEISRKYFVEVCSWSF